MKTITFHFATALAEIAGYCLLWLWLKQNGSPWLLIPAGLLDVNYPDRSATTILAGGSGE